jgi:hypothetical protein
MQMGRELKATTTTIIVIKREPFSIPSCFSTYFESASSLPSFYFFSSLPFFSCFQGRMQAYIVV